MERLVLSWLGKPFAFELMPGLNRLGRNPTNDFRVADASISSFHCELNLNPDNTLNVRDLASTNGTFIDGNQVSEGKLRPGQTLRLGTVEFALEKATVAEPEPVLAGGGSDTPESWTQIGDDDSQDEQKKQSLLGKLTKTLKIPFSR
jgi:pSer/pThr/pTyr-binding forkhead associated (FHA) protein